jgi:hypothetical protein
VTDPQTAQVTVKVMHRGLTHPAVLTVTHAQVVLAWLGDTLVLMRVSPADAATVAAFLRDSAKPSVREVSGVHFARFGVPGKPPPPARVVGVDGVSLTLGQGKDEDTSDWVDPWAAWVPFADVDGQGALTISGLAALLEVAAEPGLSREARQAALDLLAGGSKA